jgi:solute carrier family 35 protein E3
MMGLSVTLSSYWAIGMTSPLTFNVLGHLKTAMVLAAGILVFGDTMTWMKGGGLLLSMCGVVWYSMK